MELTLARDMKDKKNKFFINKRRNYKKFKSASEWSRRFAMWWRLRYSTLYLVWFLLVRFYFGNSKALEATPGVVEKSEQEGRFTLGGGGSS